MQIDRTRPRCYSGLGLMLQQPVMTIEAKFADRFKVLDSTEEQENRIVDAAQRSNDFLGHDRLPPLEMLVSQSPNLHSGLGSGTQLACAVATLIATYFDQLENPSDEQFINARDLWIRNSRLMPDEHSALAAASGRGKRSHIGLDGFLHGGWVYDTGCDGPIVHDDDYRTTVLKQFPSQWSVLLFENPNGRGVSGSEEQSFFDRSEKSSNKYSSQMLELIDECILPGLDQSCFELFGPAITRYNQLAGMLFEPATTQNHPLESPDDLTEVLHQLGLFAVGQSSWGPTHWAISPLPVSDSELQTISDAVQLAGFADFQVNRSHVKSDGVKIEILEH